MALMPQIHTFTTDALADDDALGVRQRLLRGEVSAQEVTQAAVARAQRLQPLIPAVEHSEYESALQREPHAGPFAGVPFFIKDNLDVRGWPTRQGSAAVPFALAKKTDPFAKQMLATGFNVLGKSALPEFGFNASTEFVHRPAVANPWNPAFSVGASSGGAAALVAAGVVPIAHANDGGGSIRIPAAAAGLFGLKPSRGRFVANTGASGLPINIIGDGVVTRSWRDTAHFFAAMEQVRPAVGLPPVGLVEGPNKKRLRVGVVIDSITGAKTDLQTRQAVEDTAKRLEALGHQVVPVELAMNAEFADDFSRYWGFLAYMVTRLGGTLFGPGFDRDACEPLTHGLAQLFRRQLWQAPGTFFRLRAAERRYHEMFTNMDVMLTPVLAHITPELGYLSPNQPFEQLFERLREYVAFTPINNVTGTPGFTVPVTLNQHGLPLAVQLMGRKGGERQLLELGYEVYEDSPWQKLNPYRLA